MGRINVRMPSPEGIGAGQTATFKLPIGRRYHNLYLTGRAATSGFGVEDIEEIRVMCNAKAIQTFSGTERNDFNLFDGRMHAELSDNNFELVIPFDRYNLMTKAGDEETAINTGSVDPQTGKAINSFSLEVDVAETGFSGAPSLKLYADQSESLAGGPGTVPHIRRSTRDFSGSGTYDISDLPRGGETTLALDRVFFKPSVPGAISNIIVESDQYRIFERPRSLNQRIQADGVRVPQLGYEVIDRSEWGHAGDPIPLTGLNDFRYILELSEACTVEIFLFYLGKLGD